MTNFRIVNPTTSYLNDGSVVGELPKRELDTLWEGESYPDSETIGAIATNLGSVQLRHLFTGDILWEGGDYPSYQEVQQAAQQATPASAITRQLYPSSNVEDVIRRPELRVQRQRVLKRLGWKTLDRVDISFVRQEES